MIKNKERKKKERKKEFKKKYKVLGYVVWLFECEFNLFYG